MLDAVRQIRAYTAGFSEQAFLEDRKTQQAVILNLVIIGEAAGRLVDLAPELTGQYPEVNWRGIRGMRNRLAHGYFEVDLGIVWDTVQSSLPELESRVRRILDDISRSPE
jgi:uncharacterized protein with HEPN domain